MTRMHAMAFLCVFAIGLVPPVARAAAEPSPGASVPCKATKWPYALKQEKRDFSRLFQRLPREALIQYLFHEVTQPSGAGLPYYLSTYLKYTEQDENMQAFYGLVEWGAELKDAKSKPRKLDLAEVCKYYRAAIALDRTQPSPDSERLKAEAEALRAKR